MSDTQVDAGKRRFLLVATGAAGGVAAAAVAVPFVSTFAPSEKARAAGAPVQVDISALRPGEKITVEWRGKPVWVVRRTPEMIEDLKNLEASALRDPASDQSVQPEYAKNAWRSDNPEFLVLIGVCTHLGCSPSFVPELNAAGVKQPWKGGFFCPCHGSQFDLAGRVYAGVPAPTNMDVPPYRFVNETRLVVGEDKGGAA